MAEPRDNSQSAATATPGKFRRLLRALGAPLRWIRAKPLTRGPCVGLVLAGILGMGWWAQSRQAPLPPGEVSLAQVLEAIEVEDFAAARALAKQLSSAPHGAPMPQGLELYARGAQIAQDAPARLREEERRARYRIAAGYFQQAIDQGLPEKLWGRAILEAAENLNRAERFSRSLVLLQNALEAGLTPTPAVDRLLAAALARTANPQWSKALEHMDRYLAAKNLTPEERRQASLARVEILLGLDRVEDAASDLQPLLGDPPSRDAQVLVLRARVEVRQAAQIQAASPDQHDAILLASELLARSKASLEDIKQRESIDAPARPGADYLYAVCLREEGDDQAALEAFSAARRLYFNDPSGIAAGLAEGELLQHLGRDYEAYEAFRWVLSQSPPASHYSNPWVSLDGMRTRLLAAHARWLGQHDFSRALELAKALPPVFSKDRAMQLQAEARRAWAVHLQSKANSLSRDDRSSMLSDARRQFRLAGVAYARLALLRTTSREYPDDLWASADSYLQGHDFDHAARMFRLYLDQDVKLRRADALAHLGEALMALGESRQALAAFRSVLQSHPRHPATYRARLLAAQTHAELGDIASAKKMLRENLENELLSPQSLEWRDSLFLLGETLYREGAALEAESRKLGVAESSVSANKTGLEKLQQSFEIYREAIDTLDEAVARYPEAPQTLRARYYLAEAHRNSAYYPRLRLPTVALEATRGAVEQEMREELTKAVDVYSQVIDALTWMEKSGEQPPTPSQALDDIDQAMLRNAYFGRADALFDLGRYEEAIRAYTLVANRYQNEPTALEAFVQIAGCHRRLQRAAEAQGVLEQAKVVLGRMAPDADFERTTRYGRKQWEELLGLLTAQ